MTEWTEMLREKNRQAMPPAEGEFKAGGLREPVEVLWDRWGVPHIYARTLPDLWFAQGYVTASHRMFQMELSMRLGTGRLAELFGEFLAPLDRFIRTVGWNRAGKRLARKWNDQSMEMANAFAAGTRAWYERMPARPVEYEVLDLDPWVPEGQEAIDATAGAAVYMSWGQGANWDEELLRAEIAAAHGWEAMATLFPELPAVPEAAIAGKFGGSHSRRHAFDLLQQAPPFPKGQGSNNWMVGGERSVTGKPLLANDPHLMAQLPSVWFETHLTAPGIDVRGVSLPFAPGVVLGHNERIAWGFTNVGGDTQDLYLEQLNTERTAARYNNQWEPLTIHREEIAVRGRTEPEVLEVRETRHGPILDSYMVGIASPEVVAGGITETYALKWVGSEEGAAPSVIFELDTAQDFEQFRAAAAAWSAPGQNFLYADVDGNIGYQCTGWVPIRKRGDGTIPVPGWTDEFEWDGYVPTDELPWAYNPDQGFLTTANNRIHGEDYPWLITKDFLPPFRVRRITELLTATEKHDHASFGRIHMDTYSIPASEVVPLLLRVEPADERQKAALELLASWDFRLDSDSAAAALHEVWMGTLAAAILKPVLGEQLFMHYYGRRQWTTSFQFQVLPQLLTNPTTPWFERSGGEARDETLRRSLDAALEHLTGRLGEDMAAWQWGDIHHVRFVGQLAMIPDLAELFTGGIAPIGGNEQTVLASLYEPAGGTFDAVVVPSWRQILDVADWDASVGTHTVGQSGHPASEHFNDLFELWSTGRYHPLPYSRAAVEAAATSTMTLAP